MDSTGRADGPDIGATTDDTHRARLASDFPFTAEDADRLRAALGAENLLLASSRDALIDVLRTHPEVDVIGGFFPPLDDSALAPNLRWIALASAGVEHALRLPALARTPPPIVTNASGIHAVPISEFVLGMLLQWARGWPDIYALRARRDWPDGTARMTLRRHELNGATLGVVGLGAIGRQVARLGRAVGMRVVATRRSARPGDTDPDADVLLPDTRLHTLLEQADYVVLAAPSTPATRGLIGRDELHAMRPNALLVNIARGDLVDEPAMVNALRDGTIAGAALDVFATEPLAPDSPLWTLPNVIFSPHVAGNSDHYSRRFTDLLLDNLGRYRRGEPLRNVVDVTRGY